MMVMQSTTHRMLVQTLRLTHREKCADKHHGPDVSDAAKICCAVHQIANQVAN